MQPPAHSNDSKVIKAFTILGVAAAYYSLAYLILELSRTGGYISPIWPSAGLGLAAVILAGRYAALGAALGAFLVNFSLGAISQYPFITCVFIGIGAGSQALFGLALLNQYTNFDKTLINEKAVVQFIIYAGLLSATVSASVSSMSLYASGNMQLDEIPRSWMIWWLGDCFGIIVATPMILSLFLKNTPQWKDRSLIVNTAFIVLLSATSIIFLLARSQETARLNYLIDQTYYSIKNSIDYHLKAHVNSLYALAPLLSTHQSTDIENIRAFTLNTMRRTPGLTAISWNDVVTHKDLESYLKDKPKGFMIYETAQDGSKQQVSSRDKYIVVSFTEPYELNKRDIGFDILSDKVHKEAIKNTIKRDTVTASQRVRQVQDKKVSYAIILFLPHHTENKIAGFVTGVLRLDKWIQDSVSDFDTDNINLKLLDRTYDNEILYNNHAIKEKITQHAITDSTPDMWLRQAVIEIGGRVFALHVQPSEDWIIEHKTHLAWLLLIFCMSLTVIIGSHILIITGKHHTIKQLSETKEKANQALEKSNKELESTLSALKVAQTKLIEQEKYASLGQLVSGVAHEINTPIGSSVTASSLACDKLKEFERKMEAGDLKKKDLVYFLEDLKDALEIVLKSNSRSADIVRNFKQITADQQNEKRRVFKLKEHIECILSSVDVKLKNDNHKITLKMDEIELDSYPGAFTSIFTHLTMNSLLHGFENKTGGNIYISVTFDDKLLHVYYSDDGNGMIDGSTQKLFEPFYTTKRGTGAPGLGGTTIFNAVTHVLGGNIVCRSEQSEGIEFHMTFPVPSESIIIV
ncbi:CHASE domain-containing protein [Pleionea sp. CnH1-48]|uniref:CHASE domain-containing protein n=1 Tax=Pleionea sp. CnH1-48 TaxID=2954494 RepID=UPI002096ED1A|nr:CHASE domain-containing protein [Pleionea sp. CnH1-48]MCO7224049.1 CHASE domain-containing protein [Pleionea sp. CnH1-48]